MHAEQPHQRIERHTQIANVINLQVQCLLGRDDDAVNQQRRLAPAYCMFNDARPWVGDQYLSECRT
jgi:hypothetical protein